MAFFWFPICQLGLHGITPSHHPLPHDALNLLSPSPPPYPRQNVFVAAVCQPPAIIFPLLPNTTCGPLFHYYLSTTDDRTKPQAPQSRAQLRRLAAQQQLQPTSHSPALLRTLLRLWPYWVSLGSCHGLVRVRRREPRQLYSHIEIDTLRSLYMYWLPEVWG